MDHNRERAITHFMNKEYSEAEFFYKKECHSNPDSRSWLSRGLCFKFMEMYESAVYCFHKSLQIKQNEATTHYLLATSLLALNEYTRAIDSLNRAVELEPDMELSQYMKGIISKYIMKS